MEITKSYIVNDNGDITSVIVDYENFKKMEALVLDQGLAKAMEEVEDEEEVSLEEAMKLSGFNE